MSLVVAIRSFLPGFLNILLGLGNGLPRLLRRLAMTNPGFVYTLNPPVRADFCFVGAGSAEDRPVAAFQPRFPVDLDSSSAASSGLMS